MLENKKYSTHVKDLPEDDRPMEKSIKKGTRTLTISEFLAILLQI